jgi:hypothetical protein
MKEAEMGGACRARERYEKCLQMLVEIRKGRDHSENSDKDGRIILKGNLGIWCGVVDRIYLA